MDTKATRRAGRGQVSALPRPALPNARRTRLGGRQFGVNTAVVPLSMPDIVQLVCAAAVVVGAYDRYEMVPPELVTAQLPTRFAVGQAAVAEYVTIVEPPGLTQELIATASATPAPKSRQFTVAPPEVYTQLRPSPAGGAPQ